MNISKVISLKEVQRSLCNQRLELDETIVQNVQRAILGGRARDVPAITVRWEGDHYGCLDGLHRIEAFRRCGYENILAEVVSLSDKEAILKSYSSGKSAKWTAGEECFAYAQLYCIGATVDEISKYYGQSEQTVRKRITVGYCLDPNLLKKVRIGAGIDPGTGINPGEIPIGVAEMIAKYDPSDQKIIQSQCRYWNKKELVAFLLRPHPTPPTLDKRFKQIVVNAPQTIPVVQSPGAPNESFIKQLSQYVETYAISNRLTQQQVFDLLTKFVETICH